MTPRPFDAPGTKRLFRHRPHGLAAQDAVSRLLLFAVSAMTAASGYVHGREWLDTYRDVPSAAPGSWLVRIGFPVHTVTSIALAATLMVVAVTLVRVMWPAVVAAIAFHAASLALVVATRKGSVFGWSEPVWTSGAVQSRALAIGALLGLASLIAVLAATGQKSRDRTSSRAGGSE